MFSLSFVYFFFFFFFNDTATTEIYTLSLHDALPDSPSARRSRPCSPAGWPWRDSRRSEEHTSELQSRGQLVCRLLLEKKKKQNKLNKYKKQKKKKRKKRKKTKKK